MPVTEVNGAAIYYEEHGRGFPVVFVHGAGTPAEVAFDTPIGSHSWMAFLAAAGYDAFAVDLTGYGRSTRPAAMNDPANLSAEQRKALAVWFDANNVLHLQGRPTFPIGFYNTLQKFNEVNEGEFARLDKMA